MKVKVDLKAFLAELAKVGKYVRNRSSLPVLECVLLSAYDGDGEKPRGLDVSGSNLEVWAVASLWSAVAVHDGGAAVVNKVALQKSCQALIKAGEVDALFVSREDGQGIDIHHNRGVVAVPGQKVDEFPMAPAGFDNALTLSLTDEEVARVFPLAAHCCLTDESRPTLTQVRLQHGGLGLDLVSTDGYRLFWSNISAPVVSNDEADTRGWLRPDVAVHVAQLAKRGAEVYIALDRKRTLVAIDNFQLISRHDHDPESYPDVARIIKGKDECKHSARGVDVAGLVSGLALLDAVFDGKDELKHQIKVHLLNGNSNEIHLTPAYNTDTIYKVECGDVGIARKDDDYTDDVHVGLNGAYLAEFAKLCGVEKLRHLSVISPREPVFIRGHKNDLYIEMPLVFG